MMEEENRRHGGKKKISILEMVAFVPTYSHTDRGILLRVISL